MSEEREERARSRRRKGMMTIEEVQTTAHANTKTYCRLMNTMDESNTVDR